ncbi:uncharacterized protein LOC113122824 [Mastacembelus armatus]|uniref:uncharacterized protein LOC113122824 n=1 Tax=Mastacembelus armatus TaxID=205130 RepID=UPI000E454D0E|nr:uncharacterized protein LOC113122824 [Mastacembelus armatus]
MGSRLLLCALGVLLSCPAQCLESDEEGLSCSSITCSEDEVCEMSGDYPSCVPKSGEGSLSCSSITCKANEVCEMKGGSPSCVPKPVEVKPVPHHVGWPGREFFLSFMQNYLPNYDAPRFQLYITAVQPNARVTVQVPSLKFKEEHTINAGNGATFSLPTTVEIYGSVKSPNTVHIEASADVTVTALSYKQYTADTAVIFPVTDWGTEYFIFTPTGTPQGSFKEFSVTNGKESNKVEIFPQGSISFQGRVYDSGSQMVIDLQPYESVQLQSPHDLSGTRVTSQRPVAVFTGHTCTWQFSKCNFVFEQLLPVSGWGSSFIVPPLSIQTKYDSVFLQASQPTKVTVQYPSRQDVLSLTGGQFKELQYHSPETLSIQADQGIQVLLFFNGVTLNLDKYYDSFLMTILSTDRYCSSYSIEALQDFENQILIVAQTSAIAELRIDGVNLPATVQWKKVTGTDFSWAEMPVKYTPDRNRHTVSSSGSSFALYTIGFSHMNGYGSPAQCLQPVEGPLSCSSITCNANEVCEMKGGSPSCVPKPVKRKPVPHHVGWPGREFFLSFMQNYLPNYDAPRFQLYITAVQPNSRVTVQVPSLKFKEEQTINAGNGATFSLPTTVEIYGSVKSPNTVHIEASADVTVTALSYKQYTADTAVIFPVTDWGTEYFIFTPTGTPQGSFKEFSVTNGKESNKVEIFPQGSISFQGRVYDSGSQMVIDLQPYESVQLQSPHDLSGTRVTSQRPVAVFTGHTCTWQFSKCNFVFEQLLPVSGWGSSFIVPPLSIQTKYDSVFLQASQPTKVTVQYPSRQDVLSLTGGQFKELQYHSPETLSIQADQGIQVLLFFNGVTLNLDKYYDSFLMTILSTDRYCSSYSIEALQDFENQILIVAQTSAIAELRIDGVNLPATVQWKKVTGTDFSWAEMPVKYTPDRNRHTVSSSGSSFALYTIGFSHMNGYGSPAQCLQPVEGPLSCSSITCNANEVCEMKGGSPSCVPKPVKRKPVPHHVGWPGREFFLSFMQNYLPNYDAPRFQLYITAVQPNSRVTVQVPSLKFKEEQTINAGNGATFSLPTTVEIYGSVKSPNTVHIEASADVTVTALSYKQYTADTAVIFPVTDWGTEYFIFTPTGTPQGSFKEFSVTNGKESNKVEIFPQGSISFQGRVYDSGSQMVIDLQPYESVQLQSPHDLSGTRVTSQRPVAVFTGHSCTWQFSKCNFVFEQLLPVSGWGSSFIVPPLSIQTKYDSVFLQASQPTKVTVQYPSRQDVLSLTGGQFKELQYHSPETLSIQADQGIQVLLFFNGVTLNLDKYYDPFLMTILSTDRYCSSYSIEALQDFENQILIVAQTSVIAELRIDGVNLPATVQWKKVTGTDFSWAEMPVKYTPDRNRHTVSSSGSSFALYTIGFSHMNGYGSPAHCLQPVEGPLSCSSITCNANEVCEMKGGSPSCVPKPVKRKPVPHHVGWPGREFFLSFMQNYLPNYDAPRFQLYITAVQPNARVTVQVPSLKFKEEHTINAGNGATFSLPTTVEIYGSVKSPNTVHIEASADVTVTALSYKQYTADTAVIFPVTDWGTEYFIFTPTGTPQGSFKEFSVTNGKESNKVEIFPQGSISFQGRVYGSGSQMVIDLQPYESVQLQSPHDLSGTRVTSQRPVAVFTGHTCTWQFSKCNFVFEQLLPVSGWGSSFIVPPLSIQTKYDSVFLQASQPTKVTVQYPSRQDVLSLTGGQFKELQYHSPETLSIQADQDIQVLLFFNGVTLNLDKYYDPFLMTILSTDRYCSSYSIEALQDFENQILIVAQTSAIAELRIDGVNLPATVQWKKVTGTDFSWAEMPVKYTPDRNRHTVSSSGSSFALYTIGFSHMNGYGSPAQCLQPVEGPLSCSSITCNANEVCEMKGGSPSCVPKPVKRKPVPHHVGWPGREFFLSFMQNYLPNYDAPRFQLYITAVQPNARVTVQVPSLKFKEEHTINAGNGATFSLPTTVEIYGSVKSPNTVHIEASADVTVTALSYKQYTADTAVIFPVTDWGTEYFIFTPTGTPQGFFKEFSVTNGKESNKVEIFPRASISFQGRVYDSGSQMVIDLQPYESVQLQSPHDLSGTRVTSQRPVAVFTGHSCTWQFSKCNFVFEQLLPVSGWGSSFIVPPLSIQTKYDSVFLQASQPTKVTVQYPSRQDVLSLTGGQFKELQYHSPETLSIQADQGIQVLLFFNGVTLNLDKYYDPFLMTILSTDRYCSSYSIEALQDFENQILIVAQTSAIAELRIDGVNLPATVQWKKVTGTDFSWAEMPVKYTPDRNRHTVSSSGSSFALYTIGFSHMNGYGSPAHCLQPVEGPLSCSSITCNANEVCEMKGGSPSCVPKPVKRKPVPHHVGWPGREFFLSFMQNYLPNYDAPRFQLYITAVQPNARVTVQVPSLKFKEEHTINAGNGATFSLPTTVEIYGSVKSPNTVHIEASADVTVTALSYKQYTADTAVIFPVTDWGTEYFIFTPTGTPQGSFKEFSVTNGKESNKVEIFPQGSISFQGRVYGSGSQMVIDLQPYESVQLQSPHDLSGTRVTSQRPVAVFTGHTCTWQFSKCNFVFEQLLPVSGWGSSFIVPPLSIQTKYDSVFLQASQPTKVTVQYPSRQDVLSLTGGQFKELQYHSPETLSIQADQDIQVLLFFNGVTLNKDKYYDPFLMTILSTDRYCSSYSIEALQDFENQILIVAQTSAIAELRIDGVNLPATVQWKKVTGTDFSWAEMLVKYTPDRNRHTVSSSGSSFALYTIGFSHMNGYGSPAQCLQPVEGPLSCSSITCNANEVCEMKGGSPSCVPKPVKRKRGTCWAVGDPHYRTFDGRYYDFMGTCTYVIAKKRGTDGQLPDFEVLAQNENRESLRVSYVGLVTVKVYGFTITVVRSETGRVRIDNTLWSLPVALNNNKLMMFQSGRSVVIEADFGLNVRYDYNNFLVVTLSDSYAGKTCGLCGNFNGNPKDDFTTPSGTQADGLVAFASSWKVPGLIEDALCRDDCVGGCERCENSLMNIWAGDSFCGLITLTINGPFSKCHAAIDPQAYLENCKYDVCMGGGLRHFLCKALEAYTEACQLAEIQIEDWRTIAQCPPKCPANSHYELCGSSCPATCSDPTAPSKCKRPCVETCTCNAGFLLSGNQCVPDTQCGCTHEGRYVPAGESFWADQGCQRWCKCVAGSRRVECQDKTCGAGQQCQVVEGIRKCKAASHSTCQATGDPHYKTFDKQKFDFQGTCVYQLVALCSKNKELVPFEVLVQNDHRGSKVVSYTKLVEIKVYSLSIVITKTYKGRILVNDELLNLPVSLAEGRVSVYLSGMFAVVTTDFGLKLSFNWESAAFVTLPSTYMEAVCGLCGNYNGKPQDDLIPKNGDKPVSPADFGDSWQVAEIPGCVRGCEGVCPSCDTRKKAQYETGDFCGILTDPKGPFRDCHAKVDPAGFFEDCVYDVCMYNGKKDVLCQAITAYTSACQTAGATVYSWRTSQFCAVKCPANSHYDICATACPATCQSLGPPQGCRGQCKEGCSCDEGSILSGDTCVPFSQCGCYENGKTYTVGQAVVDKDCSSKCVCQASGLMKCEKLSCASGEECGLRDGVRGCHVKQGRCKINQVGLLTSFDGMSGAIEAQGAFDIASLCDESTKLWFRVVVDVRVCSEGASPTVASVYVFFKQTIVTVNSQQETWVNGRKVSLPSKVMDELSVQISGNTVIIDIASVVRVTYSVSQEVTVIVDSSLSGKMCGACGNYNNNSKDDMTTADGKIATDVSVVIGSWSAGDFSRCGL